MNVKDIYPAHQGYRGGCKVSWYTYTSEADAKAAAEVARKEAVKLERQGYDFGFQTPGAIQPVSNGFEVTIP